MTPAYERDPEKPKVVPKDQWYVAPAAPAHSSTNDRSGPWPTQYEANSETKAAHQEPKIRILDGVMSGAKSKPLSRREARAIGSR